ncbi:MAG: hypothetical protein ACOC7S_00945 [Planctomycetota bacterium]
MLNNTQLMVAQLILRIFWRTMRATFREQGATDEQIAEIKSAMDGLDEEWESLLPDEEEPGADTTS